MTGDKPLAAPPQQGINFIDTAEMYQVGSGYLPKQPRDMTLTGWQVRASYPAAGRPTG